MDKVIFADKLQFFDKWRASNLSSDNWLCRIRWRWRLDIYDNFYYQRKCKYFNGFANFQALQSNILYDVFVAVYFAIFNKTSPIYY